MQSKLRNEIFAFNNFSTKEIQIILMLFLVIAMYCQASSSQFNQSLNLPYN